MVRVARGVATWEEGFDRINSREKQTEIFYLKAKTLAARSFLS
jgi:hypothetical protein